MFPAIYITFARFTRCFNAKSFLYAKYNHGFSIVLRPMFDNIREH